MKFSDILEISRLVGGGSIGFPLPCGSTVNVERYDDATGTVRPGYQLTVEDPLGFATTVDRDLAPTVHNRIQIVVLDAALPALVNLFQALQQATELREG